MMPLNQSRMQEILIKTPIWDHENISAETFYSTLSMA